MKFLPFLTALVLGGSVAQAQITVTSNDLIYGVGNDTIHTFSSANASIGLPSQGNDQIWDYNSVTPEDSMSFSLLSWNQVTPFTSSTAYMPTSLEFGDFDVDNVDILFSRADTAFKVDGYKIARQKLELTSPSDSLIVLEQDVITGGLNPVSCFELDENSDYTKEAVDTVHFELTYQLGGMSQEPGFLLRNTITRQKVEGWGKVILPVSNDTIEALLVKTERIMIDSVYINGTPVPNALLAGTGLEQGVETNEYRIELIGRGYNYPAAVFYLDEDNITLLNVEFLNANRYDEDTSTSVRDIAKTAIKAYPNPANDVLNLDVDHSKKLYAEVYSINGRIIIKQAVNNGRLNVGTLNTGSYVAIIKSENETLGFVKFIKE